MYVYFKASTLFTNISKFCWYFFQSLNALPTHLWLEGAAALPSLNDLKNGAIDTLGSLAKSINISSPQSALITTHETVTSTVETVNAVISILLDS